MFAALKTAKQGAAPAPTNDPYFNYVTMLLHGDGANGGQNNTFQDFTFGNTITRNGNTTQGTFVPFNGGNFSNYFDGNGDYLTCGTLPTLGTADFTFECWVFAADWGSGSQSVLFGSPFVGGNFQVYIERSTTSLKCQFYNQGTSGVQYTLNKWNHVAIVRSGTTVYTFLNGVLGNTTTGITNSITQSPYTIGSRGAQLYLQGYISNLRLTPGVALYSANFTPSTLPLNTTSTTAFLTCASNRFEDLSGSNVSLTKSGDVAVSAFSPFVQSSMQPTSYAAAFNSSTSDYLTAPSNAAFQLGTGDFTIEMWVYVPVGGVKSCFVDMRNGTTTAIAPVIYQEATGFLYYYVGSGNQITGPIMSLNQWHHIAVSRSGTSTKMFLDGSQVGSTYTDTNNYILNSPYIGRFSDAATYANCSISNLRVVKGTALYTANFTPPTSPLTAISGTSLLACSSSSFVDASSNAFTLSVFGKPQSIKGNPFGYTIASTTGYNTLNNSGSAYFNGTNSFLSASPTNLALGAGDFTVECWIYPNSIAVAQNIIADWRTSNTSSQVPVLYLINAQPIWRTTGVNRISSSINVSANTWTHIAVVRVGTTTTMYVNGANAGSFTDTSPYLAQQFQVGKAWDANYFGGYISCFRVVIGASVYKTPFTPSWYPLNAVANTSLLLLFYPFAALGNGAQIYDNAEQNDLETVGNAQISTTIKKYGTGSLYFDGTGDSLDFKPTSVEAFSQKGSWTIECWIYPLNLSSSSYFYSQNTTNFLQLSTNSNGYLIVDRSGVGSAIVSTSPLSLNTWQFIALVSDGTNLRLYINGTQSGSTVAVGTQVAPASAIIRIGAYQNSGGAPTIGFNGYIDDFRITQGIARYTTTFTPPTAAFPNY